MEFDIKGKIMVITGAARGIGACVVQRALSEGVQQVTILDVDVAHGEALQKELNEQHGADKVKFVRCDVTDEQQLRASLTAALADRSQEYVVVNGAGILNDSKAVYRKSIEVNVLALITGSLVALDLMRADRGGRGGTIINISSIAGLDISPFLPVYHATKSAVLVFSVGLGLDENYTRTSVRVLTMCFGATDTGLLALQNMGTYDEDMNEVLSGLLKTMPLQSAEAAAQAVLDMYRTGASSSVWLSQENKPAQEITHVVKKAYADMMAPVTLV